VALIKDEIANIRFVSFLIELQQRALKTLGICWLNDLPALQLKNFEYILASERPWAPRFR
jgi:hypothetical protein